MIGMGKNEIIESEYADLAIGLGDELTGAVLGPIKAVAMFAKGIAMAIGATVKAVKDAFAAMAEQWKTYIADPVSSFRR